jgi:hypothetical protein
LELFHSQLHCENYWRISAIGSPRCGRARRGISLVNEIAAAPVITSEEAAGANVTSQSRTFTDAALSASPGSWNLPAGGVAPGAPAEKK